MHILIADDDRNFGFVMKTELEREAHTVDLVHDGVEAVMHFLNSPYDAVFLDLSMPRLDGRDALKIIKKINPDILAVFFSGNGGMVGSQEQETSGVNGAFFFQKPFEINKIMHLIHGFEVRERQ
ncbi:MAG: response regulator [Thermodesulfovibrionales bacterium]|jgi:CheY-like chemotaxis protein